MKGVRGRERERKESKTKLTNNGQCHRLFEWIRKMEHREEREKNGKNKIKKKVKKKTETLCSEMLNKEAMLGVNRKTPSSLVRARSRTSCE